MPWQVTSIGLIVLVLSAGGAAAVGAALIRWLARRRAAALRPEPRCGKCGYIVGPGAGDVCPECGAGLGQVGIVAPSLGPPTFPLLPLWMCCIGATLLAWWAGPRLAQATPWGWDFHAGYQIHTTRTRWVPSMHEGAFGVNARGFGRGRAAAVHELNVNYSIPGAGWITLEVGRGGSACRLPTGAAPVAPLSLREAVPRFVETAGFDPAGAEGLRLTKEIETRVERFLAGDLPTDPAGTAGDWPGRTRFDSIQYTPNEVAPWVAAALVWVVAAAAAAGALRAWQRYRSALFLRDGRRLFAKLRLHAAG